MLCAMLWYVMPCDDMYVSDISKTNDHHMSTIKCLSMISSSRYVRLGWSDSDLMQQFDHVIWFGDLN